MMVRSPHHSTTAEDRPLGPLPDWPAWADRLGFVALVLMVAGGAFLAVYASLRLGGELWPS